ncbi:DNA alkylation repair protein [Nanhaiella sioensis]|uniref:DNA alkylation repair protein n=1 Tax=Nanhaiella sioensis TaxID=3115293 RepID=UPI003F570C21
MYTESFFIQFANIVKEAYPQFDSNHFTKLIYCDDWDSKELKQRMRHITICLRETFPPSYEEALAILYSIAPRCRGIEYLFFPDFVEVYGLEHWDISIAALEHFTKFSTSEGAVRPFIIASPKIMMEQMLQWAKHDDHHVRRLASEGCRPRLPWNIALKDLKIDPTPILPILEYLKRDSSEYVRRSVANNLNDISKDHPHIVKKIAKEWYGHDSHTNWIIKHGCRTLLKQGDPEALILFGFDTPEGITVDQLSLSCEKLTVGDDLTFSFSITNTSKRPKKLRVDYEIHFVKANNKTSAKKFKITENTFVDTKTYTRTHSFKDLSTRKHYEGLHMLKILINSEEKKQENFYLYKPV